MNNALIYNPTTWLDQFFTDFDKAWVGHKKSFSPAVDIVEEAEAYLLRAELPGVAKENLKIEVKENRLTLSGKKEQAASDKSEYRYVESSYGEFSRSFELPRNVNGEAIKAEYLNGVLSLRIPKGKENLPRSIEIQ
jgi:HSP20 family protein